MVPREGRHGPMEIDMARGSGTTFFELQARHRRSALVAQAACFGIVACAGMATSALLVFHLGLVLFALLVVTSLALLGGGLALCSAGVGGVGEAGWEAGLGLLGVMQRVLELFPFDEPRVLLPAAIALPALAWLAVAWVWRRVGSGETLLHLGAREPRSGDLEERQLANVAAEMALAAGIRTPGVSLIEDPRPNAAAVGSSLSDVHVVVARRLIDELDRAETQAVVGHLIASICDGDLRLAATIQAVFYVLELLLVVVLAPFAALPRAIVGRWLAFFVAAPLLDQEARVGRARELVRALEKHRAAIRGSEGGVSADDPRRSRAYLGRAGAILVRICPPLLAMMLLGVAASDLLALFAGVPIALLWRSRRYLADATAVELTRNPAALASALEKLARRAGIPPGGRYAAHLFVVGAEGPEASSDAAATSFAARHSIIISMHPPLARRLRRVRAMRG